MTKIILLPTDQVGDTLMQMYFVRTCRRYDIQFEALVTKEMPSRRREKEFIYRDHKIPLHTLEDKQWSSDPNVKIIDWIYSSSQRQYGTIYQIGFYHTFAKLGIKGKFDIDDVVGFLTPNTDDAKEAYDRFLNHLGSKCILVNPVGNIDSPSRYVPENVYQSVLSKVREQLPDHKIVSLNSPHNPQSTIRHVPFDFDQEIEGPIPFMDFYYMTYLYPSIGTIGGLVHISNGFGKKDSMVIFGGKEPHEWHYDPIMPFVPLFPQVSCNCWRGRSHNERYDCRFYPGCFADKYTRWRIQLAVDAFVQSIEENPMEKKVEGLRARFNSL